MKKHALRALQFLVTAGILVWIFHDSKMRADIPAALRRADPRWIAMGVLVSGVDQLANIVRWWIFLRVQKIDVSLWRASEIFMIGLFFNLCLPGSITGDVVKVLYLAREFNTQKAGVFLTVVVDRLIGLFILVPFTLVIAILRYHWFSQTPVARALLWGLIACMAGSALMLVAVFVISGFGLVHKLPARMPGRARMVWMVQAFQLFGHAWPQTLAAFALSPVVLFTFFGTWWCAAHAFHANVSVADIFSIMPVVAVITSLPVSFSGLGVREQLFQNLLGDLAHVPADIAVLISLTGFAIYVFWSLVGAVFYFFATPLSGAGRGDLETVK